MNTFAIVETEWADDQEEAYHQIATNPEEVCYLNHAYLNPDRPGFGSRDMAWTTESRLKAEGMSARITYAKPSHTIIEV